MKIPPNARIPSRPLSYDMVDLAFERELILDYDKGILYMKDEQGNVRCITNAIVTQVINEIIMNPDDFNFAHNIVIINNGEKYPLDDFINTLKNLLDILKELLGYKEIPEINPDTGKEEDKSILQVIEDILARLKALEDKNDKLREELQGQIDELRATKTSTYETSVIVPITGWTTITENKDYSITINVENILSTDRAKVYPLYSSDYNTMLNEMGSYGNIYRVLSNNNSITIYARGIPKIQFTIGLEIPRKIFDKIPKINEIIEKDESTEIEG